MKIKRSHEDSLNEGIKKLKRDIQSIFHGEHDCEGIKADGNICTNKAYFIYFDKLFCGVHAKGKTCKALPVNPRKKEVQQAELIRQTREIEEATNINRKKGVSGKIVLFKMRMRHTVTYRPTYLNIFPNFYDGNRRDGLGMVTLSPMSIGPIEHGQPGLPLSKNLENFHQGNKVYPSELDDNGKPKSVFYETQKSMYLDSKPHRHKKTSGKEKKPEFSVWIDRNGKEKHFKVVQSRQFYCNFYERHVLKLPEFTQLKKMIADGYNVQICGYDAYEPSGDLESHYLDDSRPFGHELVLYSLLVLQPEQYPWRKYKTEEF